MVALVNGRVNLGIVRIELADRLEHGGAVRRVQFPADTRIQLVYCRAIRMARHGTLCCISRVRV